MIALVNGSVGVRSTQAVRDYVIATRDRLRLERERHGEAAREFRSYRELERSISRDELHRLWPHADVDTVLGERTRERDRVS